MATSRSPSSSAKPRRVRASSAAPRHSHKVKMAPLVQRLVPTLYEDDSLLAVVKPAGLDTGAAEKQPRGLAELMAELRGLGETFQAINRLSRYESGILLLGKDSAVVQRLRADIRAQRVRQEYDTVVQGKMRERVLSVGGEGGESRGGSGRRGSVKERPASRRPADTQTTVMRKHQGEKRTLVRVRCSIRTTHLLRAQLRSVGLRLLGDRLNDRSPRPAPFRLTCLHLSRIVFVHPLLDKPITISTKTPDEFVLVADGNREHVRAINTALIRRLAILLQRDSQAYRLLTGDVEDVPGVCAERFGSVVILQVNKNSPAIEASLKPIARQYCQTLGVASVYVKRHVRNRSDVDQAVVDELHSAKPLVGEPVPEDIHIRERGLKFVIKPYGGFSTGLFPDHRDHRAYVRSISAEREVLNLFAYTCGFSVAAAAGRAKSTVSVDLSPSNLDWGRANFALNNLEGSTHEFVATDAQDYLKRAAREERLFDLILIDPPTFAHARKGKKTFSITRDLSSLIATAVALLRPEGVMMVSTNHRQMSSRDLRDHIKRGAGGRKFTVIKTPNLPLDYAVDRDHAKTIFIRFA